MTSRQAVIFDFDGVVIDSEATNFVAWLETYRQYRCELSVADYLESMGGRSVNLYDLLVSRSPLSVPSEEVVRARKRARHVAVLSEMGARPGVDEWLRDARRLGMKVGLASSADALWIEEHLARIGLLDAFSCISCWDESIAAKPEPDLYLQACELLDVEPVDALAIEDSPNGILAARRAGLACIAVTHELTTELTLGADLVVGSLADLSLEEAMQRLASS